MSEKQFEMTKTRSGDLDKQVKQALQKLKEKEGQKEEKKKKKRLPNPPVHKSKAAELHQDLV